MTVLHFYGDIVLYKKITMSHKELILRLSKQTYSLKIFKGFGGKIVNDLLQVPIIHQICLKRLTALLIQDDIEKLLLTYDKVVVSKACRI